MADRRGVPDWEQLLAHAAALQTRVPGAILVGGTAAALHARHRYSVDHDHVVAHLEKLFPKALAALESTAGWRTHRRIRGKLILGAAGGIPAGLRNQMRAAPLETTSVRTARGGEIRIPTVPEMLRIKAFLVVTRNATRDYLDVAALSHHLGLRKSVAAIERMTSLYAGFSGENGDILTSVVTRLAVPEPYDLTEVDLSEYKGIVAPWSAWAAVEKQCRRLAAAILKP